MFVMLPGFQPPASQVSIPGNPTRALLFNVNGTNGEGVVTRIDGASSTNIWRPNAVAYIPALEAIESVNVVTAAFTAENGLAGGAVIHVQVKSGTNALHGSAFEYYDGNALEARSFFLPSSQGNAKLVENQFGGTLGGPIVKDKLFYFGSYEGYLWHSLGYGTVSIPTPAMIAGNLSASPTPIYDPFSGNSDGTGRTVFPNGQIPLSRMPYAVQQILPLWPSPTYNNGDQNNYYATGPFYLDRHTVDTKVNWNATPKLSTFLRYSYMHFSTENGQTFGDALGGAPLPPVGGQGGTATGHTTSITGAATYIVSPTVVLDTYFGYTRAVADSRQPDLNEDIGLNVLRLPGTNGTRWFEGGWPQITIANFAAIGAPTNYQPNLLSDPEYEEVFNVGWIHGSHSVRFGGSIFRQDLNELQAQFTSGAGGTVYGAQGGFGFAVGETSTPGAKTSEYNAFASFLVGAVDSVGTSYLAPDASNGYTLRSWQYGAYVQDQWQATPKLTVNYGLRWEYFPFPTRANRGVELYDFGNNEMDICGYDLLPKNCGISMSKKLFTPRAGIAYRVSDRLVIRAGYGMANDPYNLLRPFRVNYPEMITLIFNGPNGYVPASSFQSGIPPVVEPSWGNGIIPIPGAIAVNTIIPDQFKRGYVQSWNFTTQTKLGHGWTAQAGYVGTRAVDQLANVDRNAGTVGGGIASEPLNILYGRTAYTNQITGLGTYKYDALQSRLQRNFASGYQVGVNYTFSKAMGVAGNDNGDGAPLIQAPGYNFLNYARTDLDHTHNMEIESVAELPFGRTKMFAKTGIASKLLGGWRVNGLLSLYSGAPFNVTAPGTSVNAPGSTQRADQILPNVAEPGGIGTGHPYYNPNAFAQVTQVRFGTAGWLVLDSPGTHVLNLSVFREFFIHEKFSLQFRAESFNTTNHPSFAAPSGSAGTSAFMIITATQGTGREGIDQRMLRFGLRLGF
jgi:outer membrane receptor protein involved in Fe transport